MCHKRKTGRSLSTMPHPARPRAPNCATNAATAAAPVQGEGIEIGAHPKFTFRQPILNGMGAKSLSDLRGKPTLIDFWGTR